MTFCPKLELSSAVAAQGAPLSAGHLAQAGEGLPAGKKSSTNPSGVLPRTALPEHWQRVLTTAGVGARPDRMQSEAAGSAPPEESAKLSSAHLSARQAASAPATDAASMRNATLPNPATAVGETALPPVRFESRPGKAQSSSAVHRERKHIEEKAARAPSLVQPTGVFPAQVAELVPPTPPHPPAAAKLLFPEVIAPEPPAIIPAIPPSIKNGKVPPQSSDPLSPNAQPNSSAAPRTPTQLHIPALATGGASHVSPQQLGRTPADTQVPVQLPAGVDEDATGTNGPATAKQDNPDPAPQVSHLVPSDTRPVQNGPSPARGVEAAFTREPSSPIGTSPDPGNLGLADKGIPSRANEPKAGAALAMASPVSDKPLGKDAARPTHALEPSHPFAESRTHSGVEAGKISVSTAASQVAASVSSGPAEARTPGPGTLPIDASPLHTHETFAAMDTAGTTGATWVHASARHAEAGFQDPSLGWVSVRAEASGGGIHAALVGGTAEAVQSLGTHLAGLHSFLAQQQSPVQSLHVTRPERSWTEAGAQAGMQQGGHGQSAGQQHHSGEGQGPTQVPVALESATRAVLEPVSFQRNGGGAGIHSPEGSQISVVA